MRELRKESGVLRATMSTYMLSAARDRESRRERPPKTDRAPGAQGRAGSECGVGGVRSMQAGIEPKGARGHPRRGTERVGAAPGLNQDSPEKSGNSNVKRAMLDGQGAQAVRQLKEDLAPADAVLQGETLRHDAASQTGAELTPSGGDQRTRIGLASGADAFEVEGQDLNGSMTVAERAACQAALEAAGAEKQRWQAQRAHILGEHRSPCIL